MMPPAKHPVHKSTTVMQIMQPLNNPRGGGGGEIIHV